MASCIKILAIFIIFLLASTASLAQNLVRGMVLNAKDSTALSGTSVYFDGTNIGVSTGFNGEFTIKKKDGIVTPLIIHSLGFKTKVLTNYTGNKDGLIQVFLEESPEVLEEVHLETDPWDRKKKLEIFKREFLGSTKEALLCKITNESAIQLTYIPSREVLLAYAEEPIVIINRHLGYKIKYDLQNFRTEFNSESGLLLTHLVYYDGTSFFQELKKKPSKKFLKNREKAFKGSSLQFMRALVKKELAKNGFKIFHEKFQVPEYKFINIIPSENLTHITISTAELQILYNDFEQSLLATKGNFYVDHWGNYTPPANVIFGGEMGRNRIAKTLPLNYGINE